MRWNSRPSWIWDDAVPASRANADANSHFSTRLRSFIRSSASAATLGLCFCELLAGFPDEKVGGGEHRLARCARDDEVAALHGQSRYSVESVDAAHLRRAAQLALDRERVESSVVFGHVHVLLREPVRDPFGEGVAAQPHPALQVDGVEQRSMQPLELSDGLQSVENPGIDGPVVVQNSRQALELHVARQSLRPGFEVGLQSVAVRAAVPEKFEHFDLARGLDPLWGLQFDVIDALDGRTLSVRGKDEEQAGKDAQQTKNHGAPPWGADSILGDFGDSDKRRVHSVLRQLLPDTVDLVHAGVGPEPDSIPHAFFGEIGRLDARFQAHQRQPCLEVVRIGRVLERAGLKEIAVLGCAGLAGLLGRLPHLAFGDRLLFSGEDPVEIEARLVLRLGRLGWLGQFLIDGRSFFRRPPPVRERDGGLQEIDRNSGRYAQAQQKTEKKADQKTAGEVRSGWGYLLVVETHEGKASHFLGLARAEQRKPV